MNCPVCNVSLNMMDKQGITIDYCPQCRWVWLDRWELEKLIEKSIGNTVSSPNQSNPNYNSNQHHEQRHDYHKDDYHHKKKKDSIWWEIFDF